MFIAISLFAFLCVPLLTFITPSLPVKDAHMGWLKLMVRNYWLSLVGLTLCMVQLMMWAFPYPSGIHYWISLAAGLVVAVIVGILLTREYLISKRNPANTEGESEES